MDLLKKCLITGLSILPDFTNASSLSAAPLNAILLSCISMNNQDCTTRPQVINFNGDESVFFPFNMETSNCSGSCNSINYLNAKICVPEIIKNLNVKVFNLMSRTNEASFMEWHKTCKCEYKFEENVCNDK